MKSIHQQLSEINNTATSVDVILANYKMGFITISEMWGQINDVEIDMERVKSEIMADYGVNEAAINLMLTL